MPEKFKTIEEAKEWVRFNQKLIDDLDCPMRDLPEPTEDDLAKCEIICRNHWGCHTFRHLRGARHITMKKEHIMGRK